MPKARTVLELSSDEKKYLEKLIKKPTIEVRVYKRARIRCCRKSIEIW